MISIHARSITKKFGTTVALNDISLDIEKGELFFLLGPSGCGKTTLLRHIAGFYKPNSGSIFFGEDDVTSMPAHKRNTAMMFQSYALWPHMDVAKNVAFGLEERKVDKSQIDERVAEALAQVKMAEYASRKINQLSGGQQQRVALARALVVRPRCLLLDEPLSNLDAQLRLEMRTEIRRICKEFGLTAVYVTHDQKEALSVADRMAILDAGKVVQVGTPQEIFRNPHTERVANFIGETNFIPARVREPGSKDFYYVVDSELGEFTGRVANRAWTPGRGDRVTLSIRPECFKLSSAQAKHNVIAGRLRQRIYLGELAQYHLGAAGDKSIRIAELNPTDLREPSEEIIFAHAQPEDIVLLEK